VRTVEWRSSKLHQLQPMLLSVLLLVSCAPPGDSGPALASSSPVPTGSKIAFQTERDGNMEIYVMSADGTAQTRLTNSPGSDWVPSWSPD